MAEILEEFDFPFMDVKHIRSGDHAVDAIHLLLPLQVGNFEYALPSDSTDNIMKLTEFFFSSIDDEENFDINLFQGQLDEYDAKNHQSLIEISEEFKIADLIASNTIAINREFEKILSQNKEMPIGLRTSLITLKRLTATFQSISILIKNGFFCETMYLYRVLLEQIAYSYQCSTFTDKKLLSKIKASTSISYLKPIFESAGMLNGYLSDFVHHNIKIWINFLETENVNGDELLYINLRSGKKSKENVAFMISLAEAYYLVLHEIYENQSETKTDEFNDLILIHFEIIKKMKNCLLNKLV